MLILHFFNTLAKLEAYIFYTFNLHFTLLGIPLLGLIIEFWL